MGDTMPGQLHDWIAETPESIAARLQGAQEAQRQTRFTLGMMTLISMMMLILSYNAYLSFDSRWITQLAEERRIIVSLEEKVPVEDLLTHQALQDWANARNATIELLGIRVSVDDAPILGTISLFVFALWLVLVTRRENHTIGSLLRDTDTPRPDGDSGVLDRSPSAADLPDLYSNGQRWLIFHTIAASNLFVTFDRSMSRIQSLRGKNVLMSKTGRREGTSRQTGAGICPRLLLSVSCRGIALCLLPRSTSGTFRSDPFVAGAKPLGADAPLYFESMVVFLACWTPLLVSSIAAVRYSRGTDAVLRDYGQRLQSDLLRRDPRPTASGRLNPVPLFAEEFLRVYGR